MSEESITKRGWIALRRTQKTLLAQRVPQLTRKCSDAKIRARNINTSSKAFAISLAICNLKF